MIAEIENIICTGEKISPEEIHAKDRETRIKETRQIIMYFCKSETRIKLADIGRYFNQDHSTVCNAYRRTKDIYDTDPVFRMKIDAYRVQIIPLIENYYKRTQATATLQSLMSEIEIMELRLANFKANFERLKNEVLTIS